MPATKREQPTSDSAEPKARRRGPGEGSITQRADGRWVGRLNMGFVDGRRKAKSYYGVTFDEVRQRLTEALAARDKGQDPVSERGTLQAFLLQWLEDSVRPSLRWKTYQSYSYVARVHIIPHLGTRPLAKLEPSDIRGWMRLLGAGLSSRTVGYCRSVLRIALNAAIDDEVLHRNVAARVKPPKVERREIEPLTPGQARAFLDALAGHRLEALFSVALACGLREGEALGLAWEDIDFERRTITVRRQLQRVEDGSLQRVAPKTEKSRRTIVMPRIVVERLRAHRDRQSFERSAGSDGWQDSGLVFTSKYGSAIHPENLGRTMAPFLEKAGCPPQRFHDLRHACASLLFAQGLSAKAVMETLGHSQISTTADLYGHWYDEARQEVADRMDAALGG